MRILRAATLVSVMFLVALPLSVNAWDRGDVERFATLPPGEAHPEGITVDRNGNGVVTPCGGGKASGPGQLFVFGRNGKLLRQVSVAGSSNLLLDLAFQPNQNQNSSLLIIDFGNKKVLKVNPITGASTDFITIPPLKRPTAGLNVLTFDDAGNVYVSDSFNGTIWRTGPGGGEATDWKSDAKLTTNGVPPFGANGLAFNKARTAFFVANTGNDTVVKIAVTGGRSSNPVAGAATVFVNSINGADGLIIDDDDNIWVAAN